MSVYRVIGLTRYRDHRPGSTFEAELDPSAEQRAIARGSIALVDRATTAIQPGSYTLPTGWQSTNPHQKEEVV